MGVDIPKDVLMYVIKRQRKTIDGYREDKRLLEKWLKKLQVEIEQEKHSKAKNIVNKLRNVYSKRT